MTEMYDLIIIGSGVAGCGAAIYARRFELKTLVLGDAEGGAIAATHLVENYPGSRSLSGFQLARNLIEHAKGVGAEFKNTRVKSVEKVKNKFVVETANETFEAKSIILATGTSHRRLADVPGGIEFENKGVSYCATCDAPFYNGKVVALVGGSDSCVNESLILAEHAAKVWILYRGDKLRAEPINLRRLEGKKKIEVKTNVNVVEIFGGEKVEGVRLDNGEELKLDGVFVQIGRIPRSTLAEKLGVALNTKGEIKIDRYAHTNVPGVFAAGDVTDSDWKQVITGVAEGAHAAHEVFEFLNS